MLRASPTQRPSLSGVPGGQVHRLVTPKTEDAQLVRLALSGDDHAAEAIWDRFSPLVSSIARRSIGPTCDVGDLVQDTFLQLFRSLPELRDPLALRSFIIGIAMRVISTELRKRRVRRWLRLTPTGELPDLPDDFGDARARDAVQRLYTVLDKVADDQRLAFILRYVQGLELVEVAAALGISLATTKRRLQKVTDRLMAAAERDPLLSTYLVPDSGGAE
jgi:RNA polymerase sigma-70 factor (ECF subfamily)